MKDGNMLIALLRKDWRVNRAAVVGSACLMLGVYALTVLPVLMRPESQRRASDVHTVLIQASTAGLWLTVMMAAVFGGGAFAAERRERSADFMAMLPVWRLTILYCKTMVALSCIAAQWIIYRAVMILSDESWRAMSSHRLNTPSADALLMAMSCLVMCFGVGWFFSTFLSSPAIAASISLSLMAGLLIVFSNVPWNLTRHHTIVRIATLAIVIGVIAFVSGTVHYLRRVSP